ncbi:MULTISPECIES: Holliday junction branch migration protein RuvA [Halomonadaceae]|jgi:Holliday junction DNA helicase RuvA|uniref:Holliday junction branch migration complex subunit RuvA n=1 Tax=Vreelandella janggokensis TaxID=370767 RepID=A0ABT4IRX7_9GAMM|nr:MULTISPECIES: Holliday junction branch migration protein RuvA [Halomonas]MCZ0926417.1 Holliday junction branch migration protein RuvA [Halomonas janggokensis]MCZ0928955.1 Holliday junction branch migration protein RuvA [Halomonas janggokensis]MDR5885523.1 Holliday junction branch migration protein RuvA [Halomonas janggokensis]QPL47909.1 Holliday junction branch migration protein RuvA [Halomonas sp. A40-4]
MIGRLKGQLIEKQPPWIVVDVHGVGYELETSMTTLVALPPVGEGIFLYTHLTIRDDAHLLYGFGREHERALFRALIKVNGVGPKLALAILSGMDEDAFMRCVRDDDSKALTKLPGVGKKTAERLIIEMRDRFPEWENGRDTTLPLEAANGQATHHRNSLADAESALVSLGYKPTEATKMLADLDGSQSTEALIKAALTQRMKG